MDLLQQVPFHRQIPFSKDTSQQCRDTSLYSRDNLQHDMGTFLNVSKPSTLKPIHLSMVTPAGRHRQQKTQAGAMWNQIAM